MGATLQVIFLFLISLRDRWKQVVRGISADTGELESIFIYTSKSTIRSICIFLQFKNFHNLLNGFFVFTNFICLFNTFARSI